MCNKKSDPNIYDLFGLVGANNIPDSPRFQFEFLQKLIDTIPAPIFYKDTQGIYLGCNKAFEDYIGSPKEYVVGKSVYDVFPKKLADKYFTMDSRLLAEQGTQVYEYRLTYADGTEHDIIFHKATFLKSDGTPGGLIGVILDITERKQAEKILQQQKDFYENLLNDANLCIEAFDTEGNLILWNKKAEEICGFKSCDILGSKHKWTLQYPDPEQREKWFNICKRLMLEEKTCKNLENEITLANGNKRIIIWSSNLIRDNNGQVTGSMFIGNDITEKKQMEKEMARLDQLNLIGQMAASIGHEIRNPLTTVRGFLQLLGNKQENTQQAEYFNLMIEELDRANSIITEFLALAKDKTIYLKQQSLNSIVESLLPLLQANAIIKDNYINIDLTDIPELLLDKTEIHQLILNLVRNGLEAMSPGKNLTIKTYIEDNKVVLAIKDEGSGIAPALIEKIGTPFFTTKESGTGLGLAVCYSIASRHNAEIKIDSSTAGTTVFVKFKL